MKKSHKGKVYDMQEGGSSPGSAKEFFGGFAFFEGFHRQAGEFCKSAHHQRLGSQVLAGHRNEKSGVGNKSTAGEMVWQPLLEERGKTATFTQFNFCMGRFGHRNRGFCSGFLERGGHTPHQCKRIEGSNRHSYEPCKKGGEYKTVSEQLSGIFLTDKTGWTR